MNFWHKKRVLIRQSELDDSRKLVFSNLNYFNPTPVQRPRQLQWLKWDWNNFRI